MKFLHPREYLPDFPSSSDAEPSRPLSVKRAACVSSVSFLGSIYSGQHVRVLLLGHRATARSS